MLRHLALLREWIASKTNEATRKYPSGEASQEAGARGLSGATPSGISGREIGPEGPRVGGAPAGHVPGVGLLRNDGLCPLKEGSPPPRASDVSWALSVFGVVARRVVGGIADGSTVGMSRPLL
jgi:hypothetical protein